MKRLLNTAILIVVIAATVFSQQIKTKNYNLKNYNEVEVSNALNVKLIQNGTEGVTVSCNEELLPIIMVEKQSNSLKIGIDWDEADRICGKSFFNNNRSININDNSVKINGKVFKGKIKITVNAKNISKLRTSSSGDISVEGNLHSDDLQIKASSSGDIVVKGNIKADNAEITASSSGDIRWEGLLDANKFRVKSSSSGDVDGNVKAREVELSLSSSGDFDGDIEADNVEVQVSSSGGCISKINATEAKFDLHSSGDAKISGNIDTLYVEASSSADFRGKKITYKYAEVRTSSSANIYLSKSGKVVDNTPRRTGVFVE